MSLVLKVLVMPREGLATSTFALGIRPPEESRTIPESAPKPATVGFRAAFGIEDWGGVRCVGTGLGRDASNVFVGVRRSVVGKASD